MAGDDKGVNSAPAVTGWVFYNPMLSSVFEYPTFVQTASWTKNPNEGGAANEEITFTNKDNMSIAVDISLSYHINPKMVPPFYVKFRSDDLSTFTHGFLRNLARDQFNEHGGKYSIDQIMGDNAAFIRDVRTDLQAQLTPIGVELDQFGLIGAPRPPQAVIDAINGKIHATQLAQQKQNEIVQAQADAAKEVAKTEGYAKSVLIRAEAEATANKQVAASLTTELMRLRTLEKWNGVLPQMTGGAVPFIQLDNK
jgi:regulator of protease activity HflC (stomatin/prohibitin superfamily)